MQKVLLLLILTLAGNFSLVAQDPETGIFPEKIYQKGTLYYFDGRRESYSGLQFRENEVLFTDDSGNLQHRSLSEIELINTRITRVGEGALIGGAGGLLAGFVTGSLLYGDDSSFLWPYDEGSKLKTQAIPVIAGFTLGGIVIGSLVGLKSRKEKTIYRRHRDMEIFPEITGLPAEQHAITLNVRVHL